VCTVGLVAYCVYQLLVPHLAEKRLELMTKQREVRLFLFWMTISFLHTLSLNLDWPPSQEQHLKLRAMYIMHHFPMFRQRVVGAVSEEERLRSHALHFAQRWKMHAIAALSAEQRSAGGNSNFASNNIQEDTRLSSLAGFVS
jgi:hypothetical protein